MKEYEMCDWIGKWFVKEKGCQRNEYSLGYTVEIQVHFHGYVMEVKLREEGVNEALGKIIRDIKRLPKGGGDKLYFYIAYPTEIVSDDVIATCKDYGIGILKLRIVNNSRVCVDELPQVYPEPKPWQAITNSAQKTAELFHDALSNWNCLCQVIPQPAEFYNGLLRQD